MSDTLSLPDARLRPAPGLDERDTLIAFLDWYRNTILVKLDGLDRTPLTRRLVDSRTTLLGMLKHLLFVEQWWFEVNFAGGPEPPEEDENDVDWDWLVRDDESAEQLVERYRAACTESNRITRAAGSLDDRARREGREHYTLRWILVHMIEETARHAGHADILRELIDNRTGD